MPFPLEMCFPRRQGVWPVLLFSGLSVLPLELQACDGPRDVREADLATIQAFVRDSGRSVLTFVGYSGAGYEDAAAMLQQAEVILAAEAPEATLINIGATAEGIGAVYQLAKRRGFSTLGIVSTLARDERVALSPCVDHVFYVPDGSWGGRLADTGVLSPTSAAIVAVSRAMVGIGGGDIARDEMLAARALGKPVRFFAADLNHAQARARARAGGMAEPLDFRGSAEPAILFSRE